MTGSSSSAGSGKWKLCFCFTNIGLDFDLDVVTSLTSVSSVTLGVASGDGIIIMAELHGTAISCGAGLLTGVEFSERSLSLTSLMDFMINLLSTLWRQLYKNRSSRKIDSQRLFSRE